MQAYECRQECFLLPGVWLGEMRGCFNYSYSALPAIVIVAIPYLIVLISSLLFHYYSSLPGISSLTALAIIIVPCQLCWGFNFVTFIV